MRNATRSDRPALYRLVLFCLILLAPLAVRAETRWYEVELIIFAPTDNSSVNAEAWAQGGPPIHTASSRQLLPPGRKSNPVPFQQLDSSQLRLTTEFRQLRNSKRYRPLLHIGWLQPGLSKGRAVPVLIGQGTGNRAADATLSDAPRLEGTVTVTLARYLHLAVDLAYRRPLASRALPGDETALEETVFRLRESRRMKSKEVHYLDHPMLGVIALITPLENK